MFVLQKSTSYHKLTTMEFEPDNQSLTFYYLDIKGTLGFGKIEITLPILLDIENRKKILKNFLDPYPRLCYETTLNKLLMEAIEEN